jgi:spore coat protein U-like protein
MTRSFWPRITVMLGLAMITLLLFAAPARAQNITCSPVSMTALNFGTVNPLSSLTTANATLSYACKNRSTKTRSATLCFSIGEPGGGATNPRLMNNGTNTLQFQLHQDANHLNVWGGQYFGTFLTPLQVDVTIGANSNIGFSATMYGQVLSGQTAAIPGSYTDNYQNGDTALTINEVSGSTAPGSCNTGSTVAYFPFLVSATVARQCTVTPASDIILGSVPATATNITGSNTISVTCTNTTPYFIGLAPSNGTTAGAGTMSGTGSNIDKVPYQLNSGSVTGPVWGNTATASSVGNGVAGTGNGLPTTIPVYASAPSANYTPDSYTDMVTVNVNY